MAGGKTLYERLGGHDVIARFMTAYIARIRADPNFARFSGGRGADKKARDTQLNIDYMCKATGRSNYYMGRDLKTAHSGLGITHDEWEADARYMSEALDSTRLVRRRRARSLSYWTT